MKLHHYGMIVVLLVVMELLQLSIKDRIEQQFLDHTMRLEHCLQEALNDCAEYLIESDSHREKMFSKDAVISELYTSFGANFSMLFQQVSEEKMRTSIPIILITTEDGFFIQYQRVRKDHGYQTMQSCWSEKLAYYYEDEHFIYQFRLSDFFTIYDKKGICGERGKIYEMNIHTVKNDSIGRKISEKIPDSFLFNYQQFLLVRQDAIVKELEHWLNFYLDQYQSIVYPDGVSYQLSLPKEAHLSYVDTMKTASILAVVDGAPLLETKNLLFRVGSKGIAIKKHTGYYVEQRGWYKIYHSSVCELITNKGEGVDRKYMYDTEEEAVSQGAFACENCHRESCVSSKVIKEVERNISSHKIKELVKNH